MIYEPLAKKRKLSTKIAVATLKPSTDLTGTSNGVIDYATIDANIPGYTLIDDAGTTNKTLRHRSKQGTANCLEIPS